MRNILIATGIFPPDIGGSATYSKFLYDSLSRDEFKVRVLTYGNSSQKISKNIYVVSSFLPKGLRHIIYFLKVIYLGFFSDIIFSADSSFGAAWVSALANIIIRKKFIVRVTGDYAWEQGVQRYKVSDSMDAFQVKKYGSRVGLLRWSQKFALRRADLVIAPSEYLKKIIIGWGIAENKISVIYNGIAINDKPAAKVLVPGQSADRPVQIISAGRLVPWKGFSVLLDCLADFKAEGVPVNLIIAGDGPDYARLSNKIKSSDLGRNVSMAGPVSQAELHKMLSEADIFVLNSGYEGLSHQIIEAMSFGLPIIASDVGGNPEVVQNGRNGFLILYNDKKQLELNLLKLIKDPNLRQKMGALSWEIAHKFDRTFMLSEVVKKLKML